MARLVRNTEYARNPADAVRPPANPYDMRFRSLLGKADWQALPQAVQRRFNKRIGHGQVAIYRGEIAEIRFALPGWILAQLCRVIGAPLPLHRDAGEPALVSVSEDHRGGGQIWTRIYGRTDGFPQVIHSAKRFAGPTGLEEYIGAGLVMALQIERIADGLAFVSDHYAFMAFGRRWRIPAWLAPGTTRVEHRDLGEGRFAFDLSLRHRLLGELVHQHGIFSDG